MAAAGDAQVCDFLVIGGGAAGCVIARRLAETEHLLAETKRISGEEHVALSTEKQELQERLTETVQSLVETG